MVNSNIFFHIHYFRMLN